HRGIVSNVHPILLDKPVEHASRNEDIPAASHFSSSGCTIRRKKVFAVCENHPLLEGAARTAIVLHSDGFGHLCNSASCTKQRCSRSDQFRKSCVHVLFLGRAYWLLPA